MPIKGQFCVIASDVRLGRDVTIHSFVNLYGCTIGDETRLGTFVEVQKGAFIGKRCKIVGHGVKFINDKYPRATAADGTLQTEADWKVEPTLVRQGASIGSNATILGGVVIGARAIVGAGSVVTRSVPDGAVVAGNPAQELTKKTATQ